MIIFLDQKAGTRFGSRAFPSRDDFNKEGVMSNLSRHGQRLSDAERHEASQFTLAVVMAGVFAFFVAGIASAFIYAKDTNPVRSAQAPPAASAPAETTGSGGAR
jgi:hypothetical protein